MPPTREAPVTPTDDLVLLDSAIDKACSRIAPAWPLDRFIAVNPLWGLIDRPLPEVSGRLASLSGARLLMPRSWYRAEWLRGSFDRAHLEKAARLSGSRRPVDELVSALSSDEPRSPRRALVADLLDEARAPEQPAGWREFVIGSLSELCASFFDQGQAQLGPPAEGGLYACWRKHALRDPSPSLLMGLGSYRSLSRELPSDARALVARAAADLDVPGAELESYLHSLLLDVHGWASACAYRRWSAGLGGGEDESLVDLLAMRIGWEWLLFRSGGRPLAARWQMAMASWPSIDEAARRAQEVDWVFQQAIELAYHEPLARKLAGATGAPPAAPETGPLVQAAFCIDVRSEVMRRALEAQSPAVETLGFAGFFGLPIEYRPTGSETARPQLPGLLAPRLLATDAGAPEGLGEARAGRLALAEAWRHLGSHATSAFSFVEAAGLFYAGKLLGHSLGASRPAPDPDRAGLGDSEHALRKPRLSSTADGQPLGLAAKVSLAEGVLRAMGLSKGFARLVLLVGHGSLSVNNAHASGLDCGACCGQSGEVNARALASLLNEPEVREGLASRGVVVPASTRFVPALHTTTTDEVSLFDLDELPSSHRAELEALRGWLDEAGRLCRAERAPRLGLAGLGAEALLGAVRARARDWSEVRPEWGLAGNASFVVAPRKRSRRLDLGGRAFLHEYRWQDDPGFSTLELIMTAPMVVAHWINLQYYASTVDNERYGSGNKVLHNVVGGNVGVFEGSGGDLRIGLPLQSLHDGERWEHQPLRLGVYIEAPPRAVAAVVEKHETVRRLVDNGWLFLFVIDPESGEVRALGDGDGGAGPGGSIGNP